MSDQNQRAIAIITAALGTLPHMEDDDAVSSYQRDVVGVLRSLESNRDVVSLITVLGINAAQLLEELARFAPNASAEELLRSIALRHADDSQE